VREKFIKELFIKKVYKDFYGDQKKFFIIINFFVFIEQLQKFT